MQRVMVYSSNMNNTVNERNHYACDCVETLSPDSYKVSVAVQNMAKIQKLHECFIVMLL